MSQDTLESVLSEVLSQTLDQVHTALPGRVEKYDPSTQTADVKPMVRVGGQTLPVLPNVPIGFPRGGGGFLSFPVEKGDFVFLLFAESSIDRWRATAADSLPGDLARHSLTAAVALPCVYPTARRLADAHANNVVLGMDGGAQIHVSPTGLALGAESPSDFVALASKVDAFMAAFDTLFRTGWVPVPTDGGAALKAAFAAAFPAPPASVGSTVVKSE